MGNCLNPSFRAENDRISHHANEADPLRTTSRLGLFPAPSTSTTFMTPSSLTVPSYSQVSTSDCIPTPRTEGEILSSPNLKAFTFKELKRATRNFSYFVGQGGFGRVYKGWIDEQTLTPSKPRLGMVVAVKRLRPEDTQGHKERLVCSLTTQGHKEWLTEINYLGQLQHPNVVKLLGFCSEEDNWMLVYEFMLGGSLENHLFQSAQPLLWATRIKIARGAAKGLSFLHDSENQIILRDIKASNILLDLDFNAKLSDFGLAIDGPIEDMTHVSTRVVGTHGYAAPEYVATGRLSAKADVYSFGVLLLEILSGRRVYDTTKSVLEQNLLEWAKSCPSDKPLCIIDSTLGGQYPNAAACAAVNIALQCTVKEPKRRPRMSEVLATLEDL